MLRIALALCLTIGVSAQTVFVEGQEDRYHNWVQIAGDKCTLAHCPNNTSPSITQCECITLFDERMAIDPSIYDHLRDQRDPNAPKKTRDFVAEMMVEPTNGRSKNEEGDVDRVPVCLISGHNHGRRKISSNLENFRNLIKNHAFHSNLIQISIFLHSRVENEISKNNF